MTNEVDIQENELLENHKPVFEELLRDHTTGRNIFWATNSYSALGDGYQFHDEITIPKITGENGNIIRPRAIKSRDEQKKRSKKMAEVFTPSWICNAQNNLVDTAWFGHEDVFNHAEDLPGGIHKWTPTEGKIEFPEGTSWQEYVTKNVLEITCGEAPYLVSRYDTVSGKPIDISHRIGLLDRKLRIVDENTSTEDEWLDMAQRAFQSTYGYEWQGDNLVLARESLFYTFIDYHKDKFGTAPDESTFPDIAKIISWNIWQMDGLKCVIPDSCHDVRQPVYKSLFDTDSAVEQKVTPCPGCKHNDVRRHNGIYAKIMNWDAGEPLRFVDMLKKH